MDENKGINIKGYKINKNNKKFAVGAIITTAALSLGFSAMKKSKKKDYAKID